MQYTLENAYINLNIPCRVWGNSNEEGWIQFRNWFFLYTQKII